MVERRTRLYEIDPSCLSLDHPAMGVGSRLTIVTHLITPAHDHCTETVSYDDRVLRLLGPGPKRSHELGDVDVCSTWEFETIGPGRVWVRFFVNADDVYRREVELPISSWRVISEP